MASAPVSDKLLGRIRTWKALTDSVRIVSACYFPITLVSFAFVLRYLTSSDTWQDGNLQASLFPVLWIQVANAGCGLLALGAVSIYVGSIALLVSTAAGNNRRKNQTARPQIVYLYHRLHAAVLSSVGSWILCFVLDILLLAGATQPSPSVGLEYQRILVASLVLRILNFASSGDAFFDTIINGYNVTTGPGLVKMERSIRKSKNISEILHTSPDGPFHGYRLESPATFGKNVLYANDDGTILIATK